MRSGLTRRGAARSSALRRRATTTGCHSQGKASFFFFASLFARRGASQDCFASFPLQNDGPVSLRDSAAQATEALRDARCFESGGDGDGGVGVDGRHRRRPLAGAAAATTQPRPLQLASGMLIEARALSVPVACLHSTTREREQSEQAFRLFRFLKAKSVRRLSRGQKRKEKKKRKRRQRGRLASSLSSCRGEGHATPVVGDARILVPIPFQVSRKI